MRKRIINWYLIPGGIAILALLYGPGLFYKLYDEDFDEAGTVSVSLHLGDGRYAHMTVSVPENENVYLDFELPSGTHGQYSLPDTLPAAMQGTMVDREL